jgi:hypothetical protein
MTSDLEISGTTSSIDFYTPLLRQSQTTFSRSVIRAQLFQLLKASGAPNERLWTGSSSSTCYLRFRIMEENKSAAKPATSRIAIEVLQDYKIIINISC